ncbi:hypothetical protein GCM10010466_66030 [Planomonospora alba]|uniref:ATP/GTP-binding protein n=1 Tax=Planomonospora alba TaxID=161354 RepID=A0ABP6P455_9ACTN
MLSRDVPGRGVLRCAATLVTALCTAAAPGAAVAAAPRTGAGAVVAAPGAGAGTAPAPGAAAVVTAPGAAAAVSGAGSPDSGGGETVRATGGRAPAGRAAGGNLPRSRASAGRAAGDADEAVGGLTFIRCGSGGGPGCVTRVRRWWKKVAGSAALPPDGAAPHRGRTDAAGEPVADRPGAAGLSGLRGRAGTPYAPGPSGRAGGPPYGADSLALPYGPDPREPLEASARGGTVPARGAGGGGSGSGGAGTAGEDAGRARARPPAAAVAAAERLDLPRPEIGSSPRPEELQLVRFPIWLTVPRRTWRPRTATATEDGTTATVVARPVRVTWTMGDGTTVVCRGPGTAYREGRDDPRRPSPTCGHTYLEPSTDAAGGEYRVTATVTWEATWTAGGRSGPLPPLTTSAGTAFRVAESQAIVTS